MEATQAETWQTEEDGPEEGHDLEEPTRRLADCEVPGSRLEALRHFVNVEGTPRPHLRDRLSRLVSNTFALLN